MLMLCLCYAYALVRTSLNRSGVVIWKNLFYSPQENIGNSHQNFAMLNGGALVEQNALFVSSVRSSVVNPIRILIKGFNHKLSKLQNSFLLFEIFQLALQGFAPNACSIDHFAVVCSVTWPLNDTEAGGDLVLIQNFLFLLCKSSCSYANQFHLHEKTVALCNVTQCSSTKSRDMREYDLVRGMFFVLYFYSQPIYYMTVGVHSRLNYLLVLAQ